MQRREKSAKLSVQGIVLTQKVSNEKLLLVVFIHQLNKRSVCFLMLSFSTLFFVCVQLLKMAEETQRNNSATITGSTGKNLELTGVTDKLNTTL